MVQQEELPRVELVAALANVRKKKEGELKEKRARHTLQSRAVRLGRRKISCSFVREPLGRVVAHSPLWPRKRRNRKNFSFRVTSTCYNVCVLLCAVRGVCECVIVSPKQHKSSMFHFTRIWKKSSCRHWKAKKKRKNFCIFVFQKNPEIKTVSFLENVHSDRKCFFVFLILFSFLFCWDDSDFLEHVVVFLSGGGEKGIFGDRRSEPCAKTKTKMAWNCASLAYWVCYS